MFYHPSLTRHLVEMRRLTKRKWQEVKATATKESRLPLALLKYPATRAEEIKDANPRDVNPKRTSANLENSANLDVN